MFIIDQIRAFLVASVVSIFLVFVCLFAIPFRISKRLRLVGKWWGKAARFAMRHACQANIFIADDRRSLEFKALGDTGIFIANHQSFMDIPMIVTMYQAPPIMKKEVLYIPIVGLLGWICGAIPVSRSSMGSKRKVLELAKKRIVEEGMSVQFYPEGTRSKTGSPAPYEKLARALLVLAFKEKIPVTPTSIYGTRGIVNPTGTFNRNKEVGIIVHQELLPENFASAEEFSRACWNKVLEGHEEMSKLALRLRKN